MLTPRRTPSGGPSPRADRRRAARQAYAVRALAAGALVAICVWWLGANPVPGGGILISVSDRNGLDVADLVVLPLLALAVWLAWPRRRRRRGPAAAAAGHGPAGGSAPPISVLMVCTANQCRSPMAAALLDQRLHALGVPAVVRSAGTSAEAGLPALDAARTTVGGLDSHRTVRLDPPLVEDADLVLGMTRHHVRDAVLKCPDAFTRAFTVLELARRGRAVGPRQQGETLAQWLTRAGAGRSPADLAGTSEADELSDPIGYGAEAVAQSAAELRVALDEIANLAWDVARSGPGRVRTRSRPLPSGRT